MQTRNYNNEVISDNTYENKKELINDFEAAIEDKDVKTIEVTKDVVPHISDSRKQYVMKKLRKLERKQFELKSELHNK